MNAGSACILLFLLILLKAIEKPFAALSWYCFFEI